ncbi:hypothetical protein V6U90_16070 [Micromonospora sp. CPCC 206060]|uniref:hypothetical protein n=1 Tax=Micromonospora sp. CPCC 206060 TaxID=3122406 RepID=UPI002FF22C96
MNEEMAKAFLGTDQDRDAFVNRETLRHAVARAIFCRYSGKVLDVRTAVLVEASKGERRSMEVLDGADWDSVKDAALAKFAELGWMVEVIDGRTL